MGLSSAGPSSPGKSTTFSSSGSGGGGGGGAGRRSGGGLRSALRWLRPEGKSTTRLPPAGRTEWEPGDLGTMGNGMVSSLSFPPLRRGAPPNSARISSRENSSPPDVPLFSSSSRSLAMGENSLSQICAAAAPQPGSRWRTASYSRIAAAAEALRELSLPFMGMRTSTSQVWATRRLMPSPSLPMTMAAGPFRSAS